MLTNISIFRQAGILKGCTHSFGIKGSFVCRSKNSIWTTLVDTSSFKPNVAVIQNCECFKTLLKPESRTCSLKSCWRYGRGLQGCTQTPAKSCRVHPRAVLQAMVSSCLIRPRSLVLLLNWTERWLSIRAPFRGGWVLSLRPELSSSWQSQQLLLLGSSWQLSHLTEPWPSPISMFAPCLLPAGVHIPSKPWSQPNHRDHLRHHQILPCQGEKQCMESSVGSSFPSRPTQWNWRFDHDGL